MGVVHIDGRDHAIYGEHTTGPNSLAEYAAASLIWSETWTAASPIRRAQAHRTATLRLDAAVWQGRRLDPIQPLEWPRTGVVLANGEPVAPTTVPQRIIHGCFELALALLADPSVATSGGDRSGDIKSVKAGSVNIEWFGPAGGSASGGAFPLAVQALVALFLAGDGAAARLGLGESVSFGADADSAFDDIDTYGLRS